MEQDDRRKVFGFSRNVFFLGVVSFLTDVSSDMIFTLVPLFLLNVLRVGTPVIGLIEGIAEGAASLLKVLSGWLSDRLGRRKGLAVFGYSISTLAKPFLYFATTWGAVAAVRFVDRVGKGIRTSPRDALVADSAPPEEMGKSFGLHRGMDTLGAVLGLSVAALIVYLVQRGGLELTRDAFQTIVLVGIVPAVLAVFVLLFFVRERGRRADSTGVSCSANGHPSGAVPTKKGFDFRFKLFLAIMVVFTLGNSSDAFLILRAQNLDFSVPQILLLFVAFNLVYALAALPAGLVSDRLGRKGVIVVGWSIYALAYLGLAVASAAWQVWLLFALYGLYYGVAEGVTRAFVCDLVPAERRGTAYGLYHTAVGLSLLPASLIAGWLWHLIGPEAPFFFGAAMAGTAMLGFLLLIRE
ncbi:MAG: MFS transporter [Dehalococcoidia bacterium]|nr:MAG: MFS transporter [Dehalococcoidia bacterium]